VCGDGIVGDGEDCDTGGLGDVSCETLGFAVGKLACSFCQFDTSGCFASRFDASGETVIDHHTGLEWEKKDSSGGGPNLANPHDLDNQYSWCAGSSPDCANADYPYDGTAATDFVSRLNGSATGFCYASHCDWRLATDEELLTIVNSNFCSTPPCIVDPVLLPMQEDKYWTSSTSNDDPVTAHGVSIETGLGLVENKTHELYGRAVRTRL
jgi:hypothetical protein